MNEWRTDTPLPFMPALHISAVDMVAVPTAIGALVTSSSSRSLLSPYQQYNNTVDGNVFWYAHMYHTATITTQREKQPKRHINNEEYNT